MDRLILGCGYLGSRVARLWLARGDRVFGVTRRDAGLRSPGVEPLVADVLRPETLAGLPAAETVLYAIGLDRTSGATMRQVYVAGLAGALDHLPPAARLIYISSSSVYGQTDGGWVDEDAPTEPQEESGRVVLEAEQLLRRRRPDAILLRFAGIYGPGRLLRRKSIEAGEPIVGDADKWLNLIHVDDGAAAVLAADACGHAGRIYNVCDDEPVRRRDFYTELARVLGVPSPTFVVPPADQPTPPHEKGNRRIRNRRMKDELAVDLAYPTYRAGLAASR